MSGAMRISATAALALSLIAVGCDTVECGDGTINAGGACVLQVDAGPSAQCCGVGTHLEGDSCVPNREMTRCDPETTTSVPGDGPFVCCVGTAGVARRTSGCLLTCKMPDPGKMTLCGQLLDVETGRDVGDGGFGSLCDPDNPTQTGPCSIRLRAFDALQFAANPSAASELVADEMVVTDCGQWMVHNLATPPLGHVAVVTDDHPGSGTSAHVITASSVAVTSGARSPHQLTYVSRISTVDKWTTDAGDPFAGDTFVDRGAALLVFSFGREPVAGVAITPPGHMFSDTAPYERTTVDPTQQVTGANGSTLVTEAWTVSGAEPTACTWDAPLADAIPGVLWVQHVHATDVVSGERCAPPCPPPDDNPCLTGVPVSCGR